jgi:hypothetical protein
MCQTLEKEIILNNYFQQCSQAWGRRTMWIRPHSKEVSNTICFVSSIPCLTYQTSWGRSGFRALASSTVSLVLVQHAHRDGPAVKWTKLPIGTRILWGLQTVLCTCDFIIRVSYWFMQWFPHCVARTKVVSVKIVGMLHNSASNWWDSVYLLTWWTRPCHSEGG